MCWKCMEVTNQMKFFIVSIVIILQILNQIWENIFGSCTKGKKSICATSAIWDLNFQMSSKITVKKYMKKLKITNFLVICAWNLLSTNLNWQLIKNTIHSAWIYYWVGQKKSDFNKNGV